MLPLLYLHALSSGDFVPVLKQFLGSSALLSPATDYVYVRAGGVHLRIRPEGAKAAVLVLMGVRADGTKELIAMTDGYHESPEAWAGLLRDAPQQPDVP